MKNHSSVGIVVILFLAAVGLITTSTSLMEQDVRAPTSLRSAPPLVAGDNVYVVGGVITPLMEIMRFCLGCLLMAQHFQDKINLSNTNDSESERVELDSDGRKCNSDMVGNK